MAEKGKLQASTLFKNIGVDVDFVAKNANDSNNRLNDLYWNKVSGRREGAGGQIENVKLPKNLSMIRNYDVDVNHAAVQSMTGGVSHHAAAQYSAPNNYSSAPTQANYAAAVPAPTSTIQVEIPVAVSAPGAPAQVSFDHAMISQMKAELMQYVDTQISSLASKMQQFADQTDSALSDIKRNVNDAATNTRPAAARPKEDTSNNPAAAKLQQQNAVNPADVAISKMFNFSHSGGNGKFQR